jgi:hypothetical protein
MEKHAPGKVELEARIEGLLLQQPLLLQAFKVAIPLQSPTEIHATLSRLEWAGIDLTHTLADAGFNTQNLKLSLQGEMLNQSLDFGLQAFGKSDNSNTELHFSLKTRSLETLSVLPLGAWIPDEPGASFSARWDLRGQLTLEETSAPNLTLNGKIEAGSLTLPASGITAQGIRLECPEEAAQAQDFLLALDLLKIPTLEIHNLRLSASLLHPPGIALHALRFEFAQGHFEIIPEKPLTPPFRDGRLQLRFSGLEMSELRQSFPQIRDDLEGKVEGNIPLFFEEGKLSWGEGEIRLMPGSIGRLRCAEDGWISPSIPDIMIDPRTNTDLRSVLGDLEIHELSFLIQSSANFDQPSLLRVSGRSMGTSIEVPIEALDLNINAPDLPRLIRDSLSWNQILNKLKPGK